MLIFRYGFLLCCMFPWVSFNLVSTETQPWVIMFCIFFILSNIKNIKINELIIISIPFFVLLLGVVLQDDLFLTIRASLSYFVFCMVFLWFRDICFRKYLYIGFFKKCNIVWILFAIIQFFLGNSIVDFILFARTSADRGVTSLAPEPTFFAIYLFFMNWVYLKNSDYRINKDNYILIMINSLSIIFLAKSSLGFIILFSGFLVFFFLSGVGVFRKILTVILLACICVSFFLYVRNFLDGTRLANILDIAAVSSYELFYQDGSANERLKNIIYPILGFFDNGGMPGGFSSFQAMHDSLLDGGSGFFWYGDGGDKILSMVGSVVYELGFLGVFIFVFILKSALSKSKKSFVEVIFLIFICLNAISVAFPMVAIMLSLIISRKEKTNV